MTPTKIWRRDLQLKKTDREIDMVIEEIKKESYQKGMSDAAQIVVDQIPIENTIASAQLLAKVKNKIYNKLEEDNTPNET